MNGLRSIVAVVLLAFAAPAFAQTAAAPAPAQAVGWSSLSPAQQQLLHPYAGQWQSLPPERQAALARGSQRWLAMPPEQRTLARQRFEQWRALPPSSAPLRASALENSARCRLMNRRSCATTFTAFRACRRSGAAMLRERWQNATPAERQKMIARVRARRAHPLPAERRKE
jgi:hypothetical protein